MTIVLLQSGSLLAAALPRIVAAPVIVASSGAGGGAGAGGSGAAAANNGGASPAGEPGGAGSGNGTPHRDAGPPTPTHSENTDPHAPPLHLDQALPRKSKSSFANYAIFSYFRPLSTLQSMDDIFLNHLFYLVKEIKIDTFFSNLYFKIFYF